MFNFIKVKDNVWLNINSITSIEYYPYEDKKEALGIIEQLRQHGVFLE